MKNPVHPGALAKANLDELNLSVAEAAKTMKITRQQLHNVMKGRSAVTPEMALRFEKAFGGSADMWLRMQAAYDLAQARKNQRKMNIPRLVEHPSLRAPRRFTKGPLCNAPVEQNCQFWSSVRSRRPFGLRSGTG